MRSRDLIQNVMKIYKLKNPSNQNSPNKKRI